MPEIPNERKTIPKQVRFEVFKRDSFKCQYCGRAAPDVILQVDHIHPVARGGDDAITNLITSCVDCNSGKSDRVLSDRTVISKVRDQLQELQERREQLEMMLAWKEGLRDLKEETLDRIVVYWDELAPGYTANEHGRRKLRAWLRAYALDEILEAMDVAAEKYLKFEPDEKSVTRESWALAFSKIPGCCRMSRQERDDPDLKEVFYIRGIVRNKCKDNRDYRYDDAEALSLISLARERGVSLSAIRHVALGCRFFNHFKDGMNDAMNRVDQ